MKTPLHHLMNASNPNLAKKDLTRVPISPPNLQHTPSNHSLGPGIYPQHPPSSPSISSHMPLVHQTCPKSYTPSQQFHPPSSSLETPAPFLPSSPYPRLEPQTTSTPPISPSSPPSQSPQSTRLHDPCT